MLVLRRLTLRCLPPTRHRPYIYYVAFSEDKLKQPTYRGVSVDFVLSVIRPVMPKRDYWWLCGYCTPVINDATHTIVTIRRTWPNVRGPFMPGVDLRLTEAALEWWERTCQLVTSRG